MIYNRKHITLLYIYTIALWRDVVELTKISGFVTFCWTMQYTCARVIVVATYFCTDLWQHSVKGFYQQLKKINQFPFFSYVIVIFCKLINKQFTIYVDWLIIIEWVWTVCFFVEDLTNFVWWLLFSTHKLCNSI